MDTLDYYGVSWDWKSSSPGEYSHFSVQDVGKDDELSEHAAVLRAWQQAKKFGHECISSAAERFSVYIGSGGVRATPWASQTLVLPGPPNFGHGKSAAICAFVRNQTKWLLYTTESDFVLRLDQAELKLPSAGGDFYEVTSGSILTIHERRSLDSRPTSNDSWPGIILRIECRPPIADFRAELEVWNEAQARIIRCRFPGFSLADEALASGIVDLQDQLKYLCGPDLLERRPLLDGQALVVPPGALMTKLSSKLIDPAVMKESRIPFSYSGEHVLVDKVLGSHEIYALWSKSE
ncbi:hypothetical protein EJ06DRAFT_553477 [Trichodelitschia bisporula]|uniref:Uncharacterized protein n=1 Tax=Trichodelitschia bisporula TaxID=703511 RepID=A0A6G1I989_9PEZI|nr:hypothetical protein EJ06DRAFT_553477 [Trichodelitschia bisporula]